MFKQMLDISLTFISFLRAYTTYACISLSYFLFFLEHINLFPRL